MQTDIEKAYQDWVNDNRRSIQDSAIKFNLTRFKLTKYIRQIGDRVESHRTNTFSSIDTEEKAYWLGFLYADGSVSYKTSELELSLKPSDSKHLEKFKDFLDCRNSIRIEETRCRINLGSKQIKEDLIKWGCTPQKSLTIKYPEWISGKLESAFIRGIFDGDGSITRNCADCINNTCSLSSGSKIFLSKLAERLSALLEFECKIYKAQEASQTWVIVLSGEIFRKFMNYIYFDSKIHLDRKYERYLNSTCFVKNNRMKNL